VKQVVLSDLSLLITATGLAGILSYMLNIIVKREVSASEFIEFATFWGAIYLGVGILSGIQQEVTRAASGQAKTSKQEHFKGARPMTIGVMSIVFTALVLCTIFTLLLPSDFFGAINVFSGLILFMGLTGYVVISISSGLFYGGQNAIRIVATMIFLDALLRFIFVNLVAFGGYSSLLMEIAVGLPFVIVPLAIAPLLKKYVPSKFRLDVSPFAFFRNALITMTAAGSMAFLISGFPLVLKLMLIELGTSELAAIIFVITLSRAPLIVVAMSLQSFLISKAKNNPGFAPIALKISLLISLLAFILGIFLAFWGDQLFTLVSGNSVQISFVTYLAIGLSSGVIAVLFVIGSVLLASSQHIKYLFVWGSVALVTLASIGLQLDAETKLICSLLLPPLFGIGVFFIPRLKIRGDI
jgi:hypothetical protein